MERKQAMARAASSGVEVRRLVASRVWLREACMAPCCRTEPGAADFAPVDWV